jgi:hypothetical protein
MDLDVLKDQWRQHAQEEMPVALEAHAVMTIITAKATDIRRSVRRRLRREATYYLPMLAITVTLFFQGITPIRLGFAAGLLLLLGGIAATLWLAQRRIAETMFDRSVRDALIDLRSKIDAAARAYLAAYVITFVCSAAVLAAMVWWRQGIGAALVATVVIGSLAIWWSYRSGQSYVERLFRRDRTNLSECLGQLNAEHPR